MTLSEQTVRVEGWRAFGLALVAGYIDSFTLLRYHVFTSFMSGNTTHAGLEFGQGRLAQAGPHLLAISLFVGGAFVGTLLLHAGYRRPLTWLCGLVAALLSAGLAAACLETLPGWFSIILFALAMGVLSCTVTRVGGQPVGVGFLTGDLNKLGGHIALAARSVPVSNSQGPWDTHWWRAALLIRTWGSFLLGALLAGAAMSHFGAWILLAPILLLLTMAACDRDASPPA